MFYFKKSKYFWLYHIVKCHGLFSFRLTNNLSIANSSMLFIFLCAYFGIFDCTILTISYVYTILQQNFSLYNITTYVVVTHLSALIECSTMTIIFLFLLIKRNKFIDLFNQGWLMRYELKELGPNFFDKKCSGLIFRKLYALIYECFALIIIYFVLYAYGCLKHIIFTTLVIYYNELIFIFNMMLIYFPFLVSVQFFRFLNLETKLTISKIRKICVHSKEMKMEGFCKLSDRIDEICTMYDRISEFVIHLNDLYSMQLCFIFISYFIVCLAKVYML